MNTMQLECFIEVAENLNFARAAGKLHISQPSVTHQINSLEEELDIKLFKRTTRSVSLTSAGLAFYPDARNMLDTMRLARRKLHNDSLLNVIPIGIGCHGSSDLILISKILQKLNTAHRNMHPTIKTIPFQSLTNMLRDESIDILFSYDDNLKKDSEFKFTNLMEASVNVIMPEGSHLAYRKFLTEADLSTERLIALNPNHISGRLLDVQRKIFVNMEPSDILFADSAEICCCLVNAGLGITLMPSLPFMKYEGLVQIPFEPEITINYGLYCKKNAAETPIKEFISAAKEITQVQSVQ